MTTWATPQLVPGAFGVPVPTVLITPLQLSARIEVAHRKLFDAVAEQETLNDLDLPATASFTPVVFADDWPSVEPAYPLTVYGHDQYGLLGVRRRLVAVPLDLQILVAGRFSAASFTFPPPFSAACAILSPIAITVLLHIEAKLLVPASSLRHHRLATGAQNL